jgi:hypothetical protein
MRIAQFIGRFKTWSSGPGQSCYAFAEVRPKINSKTEARTVFKAQAAISKLDIRI